MNTVLDDGFVQLDWEQMKMEGFVVVDATTRKLAVYSNPGFQVVIASHLDGADSVATLEPQEVVDVVHALIEAAGRAQRDSATFDASYEAHQAVQRAKQ